MKHRVLGVIPARLRSTRLPRKMLIDIGGKPLIYYTWRQAKKAKTLDEVVVATNSKEIKNAVEGFGGRVIMTSSRHKTGSDRVAEASKLFSDFKPTIVVNIQGDEPLLPPLAIDAVVKRLVRDNNIPMSTVATRLSNLKELEVPGIVKTVLDKSGCALYFSRSVIPYARTPYKKYYKHLGLYGFRYEFLQRYVKLSQTPLEKAESLEQLRALEHGYKIAVDIGSFKRIEVNEPSELSAVRKILLSSPSRKKYAL